MPRGKKTTEDKKEQVKAVIMANPTATSKEIAKIVDLPYRTVFDIHKDVEGTDEFATVRQKKKEEFINKAWEVVGKALELTNKRFTKALEDENAIDYIISKIDENETITAQETKSLISTLKGLQMTNIRDIAVALGTIYDKQALASGEPTAITDSRRSITDLMADTEAKLTELKKLTSVG